MTITISGHLEINSEDGSYTGAELMKFRDELLAMYPKVIEGQRRDWAETISHVAVILFIVAQMMED